MLLQQCSHQKVRLIEIHPQMVTDYLPELHDLASCSELVLTTKESFRHRGERQQHRIPP